MEHICVGIQRIGKDKITGYILLQKNGELMHLSHVTVKKLLEQNVLQVGNLKLSKNGHIICTELPDTAFPTKASRLLQTSKLMKTEPVHENIRYTEVGVNSVIHCRVNTYGDYGTSNLTHAKILEGTNKIGVGAFKFCSQLESVSIPTTVDSIESFAFYYCLGLRELTVPDSVSFIRNSAFRACLNLSHIVLPSQLQEIAPKTFAECQSLISLDIPTGVTKIGDRAFKNCKSLIEINIPDTVTAISTNAFEGCASLTQLRLSRGLNEKTALNLLGCDRLKVVIIPKEVQYLVKIFSSTNKEIAIVHSGR